MSRLGGASGRQQLERTARDSPALFGALIVAAMFAFKLLFVPLILLVGGGDTTTPLVKMGPLVILLSFLFLPVETLAGQAFPIWLLRKLGIERWRWLSLGSGVVFGLMHLPAGAGGFVLGFSTGLPLGFAWLACRESSFRHAFVVVTVVHAAHNVLALTLFGCGHLILK